MIERYREWYEHECDSNDKTIAMIESVPMEKRENEKFQRAVTLAHHLAVCRENWLDRMTNDSRDQKDWWPEGQVSDTLRARFAKLQADWSAYLSRLSDEDLAKDFEFPGGDGNRYRWSIEGQIVQLVGHAFYHRGQIAMIVDELGGTAQDTDYLYWVYQRDPRYGLIQER